MNVGLAMMNACFAKEAGIVSNEIAIYDNVSLMASSAALNGV